MAVFIFLSCFYWKSAHAQEYFNFNQCKISERDIKINSIQLYWR